MGRTGSPPEAMLPPRIFNVLNNKAKRGLFTRISPVKPFRRICDGVHKEFHPGKQKMPAFLPQSGKTKKDSHE
jgi:hypothetical protein